jgi:hypothetical protein
LGGSPGYAVLVRLKRALVLAVIFGGASSACTKAVRRCHELMGSAQEIVKNVDAKDTASVEKSLVAVDMALTACEEAGRNTERAELLQAKNELRVHLDSLEHRANRPAAKQRTPDEIAALVANGDPDCPKGQAYKDNDSKKEIKCTGVLPIDMSWPKAEAYFKHRGFKVTSTDAPPVLKAEYGAELFVFTYAAPKDDKPPKCLVLYPAPEITWEEATSRATGTPQSKLKKGGTVHSDHGDLAVDVDQGENKLIVRIGDCNSP